MKAENSKLLAESLNRTFLAKGKRVDHLWIKGPVYLDQLLETLNTKNLGNLYIAELYLSCKSDLQMMKKKLNGLMLRYNCSSSSSISTIQLTDLEGN